MHILQSELTNLLVRYLLPRDATRVDEGHLLHSLDYIWQTNEAQFRSQLGPLYETQSRILYSWMEERRQIQQLQHSMDKAPGLRQSEMVDRLLAMNDLRLLRFKWKAMKAQDASGQTISAEDLLCRTFAMITNTEGTEGVFKEGLERLNDLLFEFLRSQDMKISLCTKR